jgi:hypothetical protein
MVSGLTDKISNTGEKHFRAPRQNDPVPDPSRHTVDAEGFAQERATLPGVPLDFADATLLVS